MGAIRAMFPKPSKTIGVYRGCPAYEVGRRATNNVSKFSLCRTRLARRQSPGRKLTPMTAIAWVYTPEGFVIGADGRQLNPRRRIESDDIVKIASYSATNVQAVGAWTGRLMFGGSAAYFDVKLQAIEIAESSAARNSQPCWNMLGRSRGASLYVFRNG